MATTLPIRFEATIIDELNVTADANAYALVDPTASFNDVLAMLNTWLADLQACSDGAVIGCEIEVMPSLPSGMRGAALAGSRVEQTGLLTFVATGSTHKSSLIVPALSNDPTVISAGKPVLTSGSPLHNLYSLITGGGSSALQWTNAWSQAIVDFVSGVISFRTRNSALSQETFEMS